MAQRSETDTSLMQLQLIVGSMITSVVIFGVVALVLRPSERDAELARVLLMVLAAFGVTEIVAYRILRGAVLQRVREDLQQPDLDEEGPEARMMPAMRILTIIGAAMAEGLGFFGLVTFLVTGATPALVAAAIAMVVLFVVFPTRTRLSTLTTSVTVRNPYGG